MKIGNLGKELNLGEDLDMFEGTFEGAYSFEKIGKKNGLAKDDIGRGRKMNKRFNKKNNKYSAQ